MSLAVSLVLLAEGIADTAAGSGGLAVDAVGVEPEQDGDAVAGEAGSRRGATALILRER
jgi:hypothetical protein